MKPIQYQSGIVNCVSLMQHQFLKCDFANSYIDNMILYIPIISHLENILLYNIKMNLEVDSSRINFDFTIYSILSKSIPFENHSKMQFTLIIFFMHPGETISLSKIIGNYIIGYVIQLSFKLRKLSVYRSK